MKTPKSIEQVAEFHKTFNHPVEEDPVIPSEERCKLRVSLIAEELEELKVSIKEKNMIEIADALCDLQYVLAGAIIEFGLGNKFEALFNEVHRSNMSKAAENQKVADETIKVLKTQNIEAYYENAGDKFLIFRKSDNKVLKSINYSPANFDLILNK